MSKFKVDDRVVVYERDNRMVGTVVFLRSNGTINVDFDDYAFIGNYHPKQCRRLVKKVKREWTGEWKLLWGNSVTPSQLVFISFKEYERASDLPMAGPMTLREVQPKKKSRTNE